MKDFFKSLGFKVLAAVALLLVGVMIYAASTGGLANIPATITGAIVSPLQSLGASISNGFSSFLGIFTDSGELQKEISNRKIDVPSDEIDAAYTRAMDSYPTREEFMEFIKRSGLTEKQIKEDIKKQLQMQKLMESLEKDVAVDDKEVRAFYDTAKNFLYKQPAGVMVNIATFKDKAAAEAAQKAIAGGAKWDAEIEKYKNDIEMATSYDKPTIITDQMLQQKELSVLKDYPMNKVTPVESAGENHSYIAIKRSKSAERVLPFDEVSGDVTAVIKNQKMQQAQQKFYGELLSRANVKVLDASIFPEEKQPEAASSDQTAPAASEDKKD